MNITYLFGAGASHNSIPIVGELQKAFELAVNWNKKIQLSGPDAVKFQTGHKLFNSVLETAAYNAKIYGTIDTFAKKLFINGNEGDLMMLKAALSLFFTVWQESNLSDIDLSLVRKNTYFTQIESRYLGLLTNYLKRNNNQVVIPSNIKFLTWNYDTQLERALAFILDKSLEEIAHDFNIYPFNKQGNPSIIHLNGVAGIYDISQGTQNLFREKNPLGTLQPIEILKQLLFFMSSHEKKELSVNKNFHFAWEKNNGHAAVFQAKEILNKTDAFVIIGYSFPNFNDEVDKELFDSLKKGAKIYYQDPNANKTLISKRFDIPEKLIEIDNINLNQFLLPLEKISEAEGYYF